MQDETDLFISPYQTYSAIDFVIGLFITLAASLFNALGLNITKLDYTRQDLLSPEKRRPDYMRLFWWIGLILYVTSQLIGSTFALSFLRAEYVAPLGSSSLIFNFIFAYLLVGTPVTRTDILGTFIIILGVIGVVVFGNNRSSSELEFDKESNLSLSLLKEIWGRKEWIIYLIFLIGFIGIAGWFSEIVDEVCRARIEDDRSGSSGGGGGAGGGESSSRRRGDGGEDSNLEEMLDGGGGRRSNSNGSGLIGKIKFYFKKFRVRHGIVRSWTKGKVEEFAQSRSDVTLRKSAGLFWAITGGTLAGLSLILAKSAVKLVTSAISKSDPNESNQFTSPLSWLIIILLVVAAVAQVYCLNKSLKSYDSTFTVPIFFATYTASGFCNSLIYLDEYKSYKLWVFLSIWFSIFVLVIGVALLSFKKPLTSSSSAASKIRGGNSGGMEEGEEEEEQVGGRDEEREEGLGNGKGKGWMSRFIPEDGESIIGGSSSRKGKNLGELGRKERRNQKGLQRLEDDPFEDQNQNQNQNEGSGSGSGTRTRGGEEGGEELEMDNLAYDDHREILRTREEVEDDDKVFDAEDFGEFKDGDYLPDELDQEVEGRQKGEEGESNYSRV